MAQALEKIFLQKVAQMPQEEVELLPPAPKGKGRKPAAGTQSAGKGGTGTGVAVGPDAPGGCVSPVGPSASPSSGPCCDVGVMMVWMPAARSQLCGSLAFRDVVALGGDVTACLQAALAGRLGGCSIPVPFSWPPLLEAWAEVTAVPVSPPRTLPL